MVDRGLNYPVAERNAFLVHHNPVQETCANIAPRPRIETQEAQELKKRANHPTL